MAGKRKGNEDDRHLWPEMLRVIKQVKPTWVVGENVYGLVNWSDGLVFHEIISDLEGAGYEVQPYLIPAVGVDAPHRRDRLWIVAHRAGMGWESGAIVGRTIPEEIRGAKSNIGDKSQIITNGSNARVKGVQQRWENGVLPEQFTSDSQSRRRKGQRKFGDAEESEREERSVCVDAGNSINDAPNSGRNKRCPGRLYEAKSKEAERHIGSCNARNYKRTTWDNFPTQPPVCSRNDGLSPGLVGITVSKHRNESIKAYGNAVVPQVVYQIFKAINEYENQK